MRGQADSPSRNGLRSRNSPITTFRSWAMLYVTLPGLGRAIRPVYIAPSLRFSQTRYLPVRGGYPDTLELMGAYLSHPFSVGKV